MDARSLIELGAVILGLALLALLAGKVGVPAIPLYLLAGLAFGEGGLIPLVTTEGFVTTGAEVGLVLLLFLVGLEYSAAELVGTMRGTVRAGILNLVVNFTPGFAAALLLGWGFVPALFLGGITYVASSSVMAKILSDLGWIGNRETPLVLSLSIIEDLTMAVYLPVLGILLVGGASLAGLATSVAAVVVVVAILSLAIRFEERLRRIEFRPSNEVLLLMILGAAVLASGIAELVHISAAVGALLAGIVLTGPAAESARGLLEPLRDLFAAMFFAFVGLSIDPATIPAVIGPATGLAVVGVVAQFLSGWWAARWAGVGAKGRVRAGALLIARGEFSIAIAELAVAGGLVVDLAPLAVTYVLIMAVAGPIISRLVEQPMVRDRLMVPTRGE